MRILLTALFFGILTTVVGAQALSPTDMDSYRSYKEISGIRTATPTVVEVPLANDVTGQTQFDILNISTGELEPYYFKEEMLAPATPFTVVTGPAGVNVVAMHDGNQDTYAEFPIPGSGMGSASLYTHAESPIVASSFSVALDKNVALPNMVTVTAVIDGYEQVVVARKRMDASIVRFPRTVAQDWTITFEYGQPLRISELTFGEEGQKKRTRAIRFLAQPGETYRLYLDSDRMVDRDLGESGNLASARDVLVLPYTQVEENLFYSVADQDGDGIADTEDNCVAVTNSDQSDVNGNWVGDLCDDFDQDDIINTNDNCPDDPNRNQADADGDKIGDACDKEESRLTEKYPWLPWTGIGFAAVVLIVLFALTMRELRPDSPLGMT